MKKLLLTLFAAVASTMCYAGAEITWTGQTAWSGIGAATISYWSNGITLTAEKNDGATNPTVNGTYNDLRVYAKGSLTLAASEKSEMTAIRFHLSAQALKRQAEITASTGSVTIDMDNSLVTWTGSASSVTLTVGEKAVYGSDGTAKAGQFCIASIEVDGNIEAGSDDRPTLNDISNTLETAYSPEKCIELIDDPKSDLGKKVYVKGIICDTYKDKIIDTGFGNATFFISSDGTKTAPQFEIYRGYDFGGEKFTSEDQLRLGDEVVFFGVLTKFNTTYETAQGAELVSLNGKTTAVGTVKADKKSGVAYDLSGRRAGVAKKGIVIIDGKKVVK